MIKEGVKRMVSSLSTLYEILYLSIGLNPSNMGEFNNIGRGLLRILNKFSNQLFLFIIFSKLK